MLDANAIFRKKRRYDMFDRFGDGEQIPVAVPGEIQDLSTPLVLDEAANINAARLFNRETPPDTLPISPNQLGIENTLPQVAPDNPNTVAPTPRDPYRIPGGSSAEIMDEYNRVQNADPNEFREGSVWKRLGSGLWNAFKSWGASGAPGGLAGLAGALATGGTVSAVSPSAHAGMKQEQQKSRLWSAFGQRSEAEKMQAARAKEQAVAQGQIIKNKQDALDYVRTANKPFYDSIMADDIVTPEEAAEAQKLGYNISPYDARKFNTQTVNGETIATPTLGVPDFKPTNAPQDLLKTPVKRKLDDGTEVYTTGDKLLVDQIANKLNQARLNIETEKYNTSEANDYDNRLTKWRDSVSEAGGKVNQVAQELYALQQLETPDYDGDLGALQTKIAAKKGEYALAKETYEGYVKNMPKKPKAIGRQNLTLPKVNEGTFRQQAQAKGITGANLEAAVKKAKADGVIQ